MQDSYECRSGLDRNRYLLDGGYIGLGGRSYGCFLWNEDEASMDMLTLRKL